MSGIIGLDIGSHAIKLIEVIKTKDSIQLLSAGSIPTPLKTQSVQLQTDIDALAYIIGQLIKDTGTKATDVHVAFAESQVFTRVIETPILSHRELSSAIRWEAEQYIPLPLDQVTMDFSILRDQKTSGSSKMQVLLVAAPKTIVEKYMTIIEMADLIPVSAETNVIATSRALSRSVSTLKNVLIVSLGAQTTDLSILKGGILAFARSISSGGEALTRSIVQALDFTTVQAEEYKKTYGLDRSVLEGKIVAAMQPVIDVITNEIKHAIAFFEEKHKEEKIEAIVLSGGTSKLPGIVSYMTNIVGIETQIANPWVGIAKDARFNVLNSEGPLFSVAVGLALKD